MANKEIRTRIQLKNDTKSNWDKAINFIPLKGEVIIYNDDLRFKIGDGTTKLSELNFREVEFTESEISSFYEPTNVY